MNYQYDPKFSNYDAILFDMDGTIFNTEPLHAKALKILLKEFNITKSYDELYNRFCGLSDNEVFHSLELNKLLTLDQFLTKKNSILINIINNLENKEFEKIIATGLIPLLQKITEKNIKTAVVSASEPTIVHHLLEKAKITHYFENIITSADTTNQKPDPMPYLFALKKLNVTAKKTLVFEDSNHGVTSATIAGTNVTRVNFF